MSSQPDDLRARFEAIAARLGERARGARGAVPPPVRPALKEDYWASVQDLFTRDVTSHSFRQLVGYDAGETLRYFAREVDLDALAHLPWWERGPLVAWKVFLAMAYRLSPARRVLFAVAVPMLGFGWLHYVGQRLSSGTIWSPPIHSWEDWLLLVASLLFGLLLLELRDKLSLKGDLEVARQIQFGLVPQEPWAREGIAIHASMRPANTVGGDYYDVIDLGGPVAFVVGDVAGKGMPAALLMALLQGSLRTLLTAGLRGPELVAKLNAHLHANIPSNRLVTFFYGEIDPATGRVAFVNAGHNPPFVLRQDGSSERLAATGVALGVLPETSFEAGDLYLQPGERLLLFTDGITEAENARDEEFGDERLAASLDARRGLADGALIEALREEVLAHCGTARPRDDMTLMVVSCSSR